MLVIKDLKKVYKDGTVGIKNVNLTLPDRGLIVFEGKSGSGKSTLLNLISGLSKPTEGSISYNGTDIKDIDRYIDLVGMIFQDYNLISDLNVIDNINFIGNKRTNVLLFSLGIKELKNKKTHEISGGEARRVAIARALNKDVSILLCDEPTESLDSKAEEDILKILKKISEEILVVIVSHKKSVLKYADRAIKLSKGEVAGDEIFRNLKRYIIRRKNQKECSFSSLFKITKNRILDNLGLFSLNLVAMIIVMVMFLGSFVLKKIDLDKLETREMLENGEYRLNVISGLNEASGKLEVAGIYYDTAYNYYLGDGSLKLNHDYITENFFYKNDALFPHVIILSDETITGHDVLVGGRPCKKNEIMISEYLFEWIKKFGAYNENNELVHYEKMQDILYKVIKFNDKEVVVSGVLKQNLEMYNKFKDLEQPNNYGQINYYSMFKNSILNNNDIYVTQEFDDYIGVKNKLAVKYLINSDDADLLYKVKKMGDKETIASVGIYSENIARLGRLISRLKIIGNILFVVFMIIGVILIFNYYNNAIDNHEKDNRVLKYLGASNTDIVFPYFIETLLLCFLALIIGIMSVQIICTSLNKVYYGVLTGFFDIFTLDTKSILYLGETLLVVIFILTLYSVVRINKQIKKYTE